MLIQRMPFKYFWKTGILLLQLSFIMGCGNFAPETDTISPALTTIPPTKTTIPSTATEIPSTHTPEPTLVPSLTSTPTPTPQPSPTSTPDVPFEEVNFTTDDNVNLSATLFDVKGDVAVLYLHMGNTGNVQTYYNNKDWHSTARFFADQGYPALTLDFRGRGKSGGEFKNDLLPLDVLAALQFLKERGYERFVCVGADVGGLTCMRLAVDGVDFEGLVVLSTTLSAGQKNKITTTEIAQIEIPKLYFYGENDGFGLSDAMETIYASSMFPKNLIVCPDTAAHGTELLNGACGDQIKQQILAFLDELFERP